MVEALKKPQNKNLIDLRLKHALIHFTHCPLANLLSLRHQLFISHCVVEDESKVAQEDYTNIGIHLLFDRYTR